MAAFRAGALLLSLLIVLAVTPAEAGGNAEQSAAVGVTGTSTQCTTFVVGTDHCIVHHTGTLGLTCQGDACILRAEGGAIGESRIPTDLRVMARVHDLSAPSAVPAVDLALCDSVAVGEAARCAYIVEHAYPIPKGRCVDLRHSTVLTQVYTLFHASVHQDVRVCRDASGAPSATLLPAPAFGSALVQVTLPPVVAFLP